MSSSFAQALSLEEELRISPSPWAYMTTRTLYRGGAQNFFKSLGQLREKSPEFWHVSCLYRGPLFFEPRVIIRNSRVSPLPLMTSYSRKCPRPPATSGDPRGHPLLSIHKLCDFKKFRAASPLYMWRFVGNMKKKNNMERIWKIWRNM